MTQARETFEPVSEFLQVVVERGYMHQCTDLGGLDAAANAKDVVGYIGFDATADSLHVGSLIQVMMLRHLQRAGLKPIVLIGGSTTKIGDPSGKDEQRQLMDDEAIAHNIVGIRQVFEQFLTFGTGPTDAMLVNNNEWLNGLHYLDFLRTYGRHFSVNRMLTFDSVKLRLEREQPLSFLEFNYMILQAYDFLELSRRHGCRLQIGGSDQWGNIVAGVELTRRVNGTPLFGLTTPLLATSSGAKMGKTAHGAVWLNAARVSPYDYWQYWRNTEDADVSRFLRLFTELPLEEVTRLDALEGAELNEAKVILANEATAMCHGRTAAKDAELTSQETFADGKYGEGLPKLEVDGQRLEQGTLLYELLCEAGLARSNSDARRLIRGGGARVNGTVMTNERATVSDSDLNPEKVVKLSAGKKRHALIVPSQHTR